MLPPWFAAILPVGVPWLERAGWSVLAATKFQELHQPALRTWGRRKDAAEAQPAEALPRATSGRPSGASGGGAWPRRS